MKINDNCLNSSTEHTASEIAIYQTGWQACSPGHTYGYAVRDHYIIHYITKGSGQYHVGNKTFKLSKGDGFLICPSVNSIYQASTSDPWEYCWVGFYGTEAKRLLDSAHLNMDNPVFHYEEDEFLGYFKSLYESSKDLKKTELSTLGYLYLILSKLIDQQELSSAKKAYSPDSYVQKAISYIQSNYCSPTISINEISQYLGIDRTQFFRHFKQYTGISPQQFLTNFKMTKACEQIKTTDLPIEEIAHSVGFEHLSYFSKVFKKQLQLSPLEYKKLHQSEMLQNQDQ